MGKKNRPRNPPRPGAVGLVGIEAAARAIADSDRKPGPAAPGSVQDSPVARAIMDQEDETRRLEEAVEELARRLSGVVREGPDVGPTTAPDPDTSPVVLAISRNTSRVRAVRGRAETILTLLEL